MGLPVPGWYDSTDTSVVDELTFTDENPGVEGTEQEVHLWNNKGGTGADDLSGAWLYGLTKTAGGTSYLAEGHEAIDYGFMEVRVIGGTFAVATTGWQALVPGSYVLLPDIPNDEAVYLEVRMHPTADTDVSHFNGILRIMDDLRVALGAGIFESLGNGIVIPIGDAYTPEVTTFSAVVESSTPDDYVTVPDLVYVHDGVPLVELEQTVQLNQTDGDSAVLTSGEEYIGLLSAGSTGVTTTKGSKAATGSAERPSAPTGEIVLAWITVSYEAGGTSVIADADIANDWILGRFAAEASGTSLVVSAGDAIVGNSYIRKTTQSTVSLTVSTVNYVFLTPAGQWEVGTSEIPSTGRSMLLYEVDVGASSINSISDRRSYTGGRIETIVLHIENSSGVQANDFDVSLWDRTCNGYILNITMAADDSGTSVTAGNLTGEVDLSELGGSYTTIFTSKATEDRRPSIAWNESTLTDTDSIPEVRQITPMTRIKGWLQSVWTATTNPKGVIIAVRVITT
jgi:hypothetical protein